MKDSNHLLFPPALQILSILGENIRLARLRRKLRAEQVAERADIARSTLWQVEKGSPGVAIGTYLRVLMVLGLEKNFLSIAADDQLGRKLQDANLLTKARGPKRVIN